MASKLQSELHPTGKARQDLIRLQLESILQSPGFRASKRSQQFLRYVVDQALAGNVESLKERVIGVEVFERGLHYDTSEDATVRVAANDVRKRLARYHLETPAAPIRIELPAGSYLPEFHDGLAPSPVLPADPVEPAPEPSIAPAAHPPSRRRFWLLTAAALVPAGFGLRTWIAWRSATPTILDQFWAPLLDSPRPVLVCLANPLVYLSPARVHPEYRDGSHIPRPYPKPAPNTLMTLEVVPASDQFVGAGDAYASSEFLGFLGTRRKAAQLRISNDMSFTDLRNSPAVLIGAYSNRWTMLATKDARFAFEHFAVVDHAHPGKGWRLDTVSLDNKVPEDYAIVSRFYRSQSGEAMIIAAGITHYGTQSAAEFLTNSTYLKDALSKVADWQHKNLQIVLHCRIEGSTPGPPEVVAVHVW